MLSNDQVFKPCTKSCKPNRPTPVAKRYSINYKVNSFYFLQWQFYYDNYCLCSLVSNPDHTSYYHCWAGCCECATADINLQGHGVAVFGRQ